MESLENLEVSDSDRRVIDENEKFIQKHVPNVQPETELPNEKDGRSAENAIDITDWDVDIPGKTLILSKEFCNC